MASSMNRVQMLCIDGRMTAWRVHLAQSFLDRTLGVGRRPAWQRFDVLCLPDCRAVHGFWIGHAIDVVFTNSQNRVLRLLCQWPPGRIVWQREATRVWEMAAGSALARGIRIGTHLDLTDASAVILGRAHRQRCNKSFHDPVRCIGGRA